MASIATPFVWAQRKDRLFISVNLRDLSGEKFELLPNSLSFEGTSDGKFYSGSVNFFDEIDVEASKHTILGFGVRFVIFKKNTTASYWPRLTKEGGKHNNITFDWDRYIDSDEEGADGNKGLGQDWDPSMMQNFGGPGGPGGFGGPEGEAEEDSDDEEGQGAPEDDLEGEEEIPASKGETKKEGEEIEEKKE